MSEGVPFFDRVLILGLGLLGASFGGAMKAAGLAERLVGSDLNPSHLEEARALGWVDSRWDPRAKPEAFDLVFLAVPPGQVGTALEGLRPWLREDTLVMDACSVKGTVAVALEAALGAHPGLLPAHPIAGGHRAGPGAARADLFAGAPVVLCPLPCTSAESRLKGQRLWEALGAHGLWMTSEVHDRQLALLSHLPHLLAYTTMSLAAARGADLALAGPGFRDATRLAQCPAALWVDIARENREALLPVLRDFQGHLHTMMKELEGGEGAGLERRFHAARELRIRLQELP